MIRGLKFTKFKGGPGSGHYGHGGRPGHIGGSAAGGMAGHAQTVLDKTAPYVQSDDISGIRSLPEDEFLKIEGTGRGDAAFLNTETHEIVLNELQMALRKPQDRRYVIAHEVGHAVGDRLALRHEEAIISAWEPYSQSLSGRARYSASEGFAELFAMRFFDEKRFGRVLGVHGSQRFNTLLEFAKEE